MNSQEEFNDIFKRYYTPLFIFAKRFVVDDDDCHDLVNDVFENVWLHFGELHFEAIKSYLYTNLRNKCIDFLRHKQAAQRYCDFTLIISDRYDSIERIIEMENRESQIKDVLNRLPDTTKYIFTLCFVEHMKYAEAAAQLNISISTVKKHIVRALKLIRQMREEYNIR